MKISNDQTSALLHAIQGAVKGGVKGKQNVVFRKDNFTNTRCTCTLTNFIWSVKLL